MTEITSISTHSTNMKTKTLSMKIEDIHHNIICPRLTKMRKKSIMVKNMQLLLEFYMKQFQEKIFA